MNSTHNNGGNDKTLHEDLDQLGDAYAKLEQQAPPDLVDQAILNSAHRAVEKKPHWMKIGWLQGLTTTGVFVLAFSLILQQQDSTPVLHEDTIINGPETPGAVNLSEFQAVDTMEAEAGSKSELRTNRVQHRDQTMAAAPVIMAEEEKSLSESDSMVSETPSTSFDEAQSPIEAMKPMKKEFGKSDYREEAAHADDATVFTESISGETTDLAIESVPELVAGTKDEPLESEQTINEHIARIIRLKMNGDEAWIEEFAEFKKRYPDFPIPEELSEQR